MTFFIEHGSGLMMEVCQYNRSDISTQMGHDFASHLNSHFRETSNSDKYSQFHPKTNVSKTLVAGEK
jgi:hypothetical protein